MAEDFDPAPGAAGFVISTPSILALASLFGALECYLQCGKVGLSTQKLFIGKVERIVNHLAIYRRKARNRKLQLRLVQL